MPRIIDVHVHPLTKEGIKGIAHFVAIIYKFYFGQDKTVEQAMAEAITEERWVEDVRKHNIAAMPVALDAETKLGGPRCSNDYIASLVKQFPDVFITGWGSVDPWKGKLALQEVERCIRELNLIGIKFHQPMQQFHINDQQFYPLWDLCQDLGAPVQFHVGVTGVGGGLPGGGGVKLGFGRPIPDIDDVAADFPRLKIIALHVGDPWVDELNAVALHKPNVYRESSGMMPRYFPEAMVYEMNRRLQDKYMFGSEYYLFPTDELIKQHEQHGYRPGVLEKLFYRNAVRILGEEMERVGINLREWQDNLSMV